jgi:hypothetical protein
MIVLGTLQAAAARERGPRVEVVCPTAPIPIRVADKQVLVYELHVTNFDLVPLTLKRLEVFPNLLSNPPLKVISEDGLPAVMFQVGSQMGTKSSATIEPGTQEILFLWIEMAPGAPVPTSLHHRMVFVPSGHGAGSAAEAILQDFPVLVGEDPVPLLSSPFDGGVWAGDGIANDTPHRRSLFAIDGRVRQPERFAIDWVKVGPNGDSHQGTARNEDWWGYGEPLYAVADGEVTQVVSDIPENAPRVLPAQITIDNIAGNYVVLRIARDRYITYAHLKNGSIVVHPHDRLRRGALIGRLGNSGNTTGPHLHFQVTDGDSVLQSEGVPFMFEAFNDLGPGADYEVDKHPSIPRARCLPKDNGVVEFKKITQR